MRPTLAIAALVACLTFAASSNAQNYFGGGYPSGLPGPAFGYSGSLYGLGYVPVPPYFAIHPPVYYSHQISRSYGDSPFAYAPKRPLPQPRPQVVVNPYVPEAQQTSQSTTEKVAAKIITNPFYTVDEQLVAVPNIQINPTYSVVKTEIVTTD